jgi:Zn-dependent peptidase ImmA (M78 family)
MLRDHHVSFRSEETIAQIAISLRNTHGSACEPSFDITDLVKNTLPKLLKLQKKGLLKIEFYDCCFIGDDPAYVSFNPLTLHVDNKIWTEAKAGDGYARFVIAHEIGHLILHDHSAKAFSRGKSDQIRFSDNEHSAEWQANTFAGHLLLPTPVVQKLNNLTVITIVCNVGERVALDRLHAVRKDEERKNRIFDGECCTQCGNFSLKRNGTLLKCGVCPNTFSYI